MTTTTNLTTVSAEVATQVHFEFGSSDGATYTITANPTDQNSDAILWFGSFDPTGALASDYTPSVNITGTQPVKNVQFGYNKRQGAYVTFTPGGSSGMTVKVMMYLMSSDQSITSGSGSITFAFQNASEAGAKCRLYLSNDDGDAKNLAPDNPSQAMTWKTSGKSS